MLMALGRDPLVIKETRIDAIYGLMQLMDDAYAKVPDVKTPVLLLYGAHDEVIPREPVDAAREHFTAPHTFIYYLMVTICCYAIPRAGWSCAIYWIGLSIRRANCYRELANAMP